VSQPKKCGGLEQDCYRYTRPSGSSWNPPQVFSVVPFHAMHAIHLHQQNVDRNLQGSDPHFHGFGKTLQSQYSERQTREEDHRCLEGKENSLGE
jgi:hypothetical protein